jgi:hypothetical protein
MLAAGQDELLQGHFSRFDAADASKKPHKRKSMSLIDSKQSVAKITQAQQPIQSGEDGDQACAATPSLRVLPHEQHRKTKKRRSACGPNTGKFASDAKSRQVLARVLAKEALGASDLMQGLTVDASDAREAKESCDGPNEDAVVEFALSKSQRQKSGRGKGAKRKAASTSKKALRRFS